MYELELKADFRNLPQQLKVIAIFPVVLLPILLCHNQISWQWQWDWQEQHHACSQHAILRAQEASTGNVQCICWNWWHELSDNGILPISQIPQCTSPIAHNALDEIPTMHHFVTEICTFLLHNAALRGICLMLCGILRWVYDDFRSR